MKWRWHYYGWITAGMVGLGCGQGSELGLEGARGDAGSSRGFSQVTLEFAARVGSAPFSCGERYEGLGSAGAAFTPRDLRFYLHDLRLVEVGGAEVPIELEQDGVWQLDGIALLDFEDASSGCENGTPETRSVVRGTVPDGDYLGLRFKLGVPFDRNHANAAVAPSPMNLTSMFWSWNGGYKFLRIDGDVEGLPSWRLHVGSTGCQGDMMGNVTTCANPNRPEVELSGFDVRSHTVLADLAVLVAGADLAHNTPDTPPGCMGAPSDPDCASYFGALGLPWNGSDPERQRFFRVE